MNARSLFALKYSILPSTLYLEDNELVFCFNKRFLKSYYQTEVTYVQGTVRRGFMKLDHSAEGYLLK